MKTLLLARKCGN